VITTESQLTDDCKSWLWRTLKRAECARCERQREWHCVRRSVWCLPVIAAAAGAASAADKTGITARNQSWYCWLALGSSRRRRLHARDERWQVAGRRLQSVADAVRRRTVGTETKKPRQCYEQTWTLRIPSIIRRWNWKRTNRLAADVCNGLGVSSAVNTRDIFARLIAVSRRCTVRSCHPRPDRLRCVRHASYAKLCFGRFLF